ncbi:MAG: type II toxin-antitoxin system ParD family antitoxin [Pyrinomonadaceae bacterium]|jgi:antitoxin ParD1/3/4
MSTTTTMNVSLPETMKSFVEERLGEDGYGTASEYIRDLIRADQKRRAEAQLEALLLERLRNSNVTEFDVNQVKAEFTKRLVQRGKKNK